MAGNIKTSVNLGGLEMSFPLTTASGTFGYGCEYFGLVDYSYLGAVTVKGVRMLPWDGNQMPRHTEVPGGLVNAIGLQGPGIDRFLSHYVPHYEGLFGKFAPPMIVNIWGATIEEYAEVAARLDACGGIIKAIECNVSCPNVKAGGHTFGQDPNVLRELVAKVREATKLPLIVKLAPNVPSIVPYVRACEEGGADALALINTIPAMVIDVERRSFAIANKSGGLSGRAVHPVAVKLVYDASHCTRLPILAMGGVYEPKDAIEFILAGATAVAVGSAIFSDPAAVARIGKGMVDYLERNGFDSFDSLRGAIIERQ